MGPVGLVITWKPASGGEAGVTARLSRPDPRWPSAHHAFQPRRISIAFHALPEDWSGQPAEASAIAIALAHSNVTHVTSLQRSMRKEGAKVSESSTHVAVGPVLPRDAGAQPLPQPLPTVSGRARRRSPWHSHGRPVPYRGQHSCRQAGGRVNTDPVIAHPQPGVAPRARPRASLELPDDAV